MPVSDTTPASFGPSVLADPVPLAPRDFDLIRAGVESLWQRIVRERPEADNSPLLLSYDVHPSVDGPVLIEINTNAGGVLAAIEAARTVNQCCAEWEHYLHRQRLLALLRRDLIGDGGTVAIVDDNLASQALLPEMRELAAMMQSPQATIRVLDATELTYRDGRLRAGDGTAIDRVYWRSTDFTLDDPEHAVVRRAVDEGSTHIAPSPEAWAAVADKSRFVDWSDAPVLARDADTGLAFQIAETLPVGARTAEQWLAERKQWVFKPRVGHASRGVYVGRKISVSRLQHILGEDYLAQRYAPHPEQQRGDEIWKYDLRFFADRGEVIGAAARVFQGQVVGMRAPGSGFAGVLVDDRCCLLDAMRRRQETDAA